MGTCHVFFLPWVGEVEIWVFVGGDVLFSPLLLLMYKFLIAQVALVNVSKSNYVSLFKCAAAFNLKPVAFVSFDIYLS